MGSSRSSSVNSAITPPDYFSTYLKYSYLQAKGGELQQQINDPDVSCDIQPNTLKYESLRRSDGWSTMIIHCGPPADVSSDLMALGFPIQENTYLQYSAARMVTNSRTGELRNLNVVTMHASEGVLTIDDIERNKDGGPPYTSQILQALYQRNFDVLSIRNIYVCCVQNEQTSDFVTEVLHSSLNDLQIPDVGTWEYDTPEYQALLGTRIGAVVVYFVLGAYTRGTRRIARVTTWFNGFQARNLQMRFDLEKTQVGDT